MTDDAQLLRRYAEEGDEAAFAELVRARIGFVYAAALRQTRGNRALAEDVTQMVFTDLARKAMTLARHGSLVGWLHTATRFTATKALRAESRRTTREQTSLLHENDESSNAAADWTRMEPMLDEVLGELKERERTAILLRFFEGKTLTEVGASLALSEPAARSCVDRALEKLRERLSRRGVTSTSVALGLALANQTVVAVPAGLAVSVVGAALAPATGGVVAGTFSVMSTTKLVVAAVGIIAAGALFYERVEVQKLRSDTEGALRDNVELRAKLASAEKRAEAAEQAASALRTRTAEQEAKVATEAGKTVGKSAVVAGSTGQVANSATPVSDVDRLMADPKYVELWTEDKRLSMGLRYRPLYRELHFSPEQIAAFEAAKMRREQATADVWSIARTKGFAITDPAIMGLMGDAIKETDVALRTVLGDAGWKRQIEYERERSVREVVTSLAGQLYSTDDPLTPEQGTQFVRLAMNNTRNVKIDGTLRYETDWVTAAEQAKGVLTSAQLATFAAWQRQQEVSKQIGALTNKILYGSTPR